MPNITQDLSRTIKYSSADLFFCAGTVPAGSGRNIFTGGIPIYKVIFVVVPKIDIQKRF